VRLVEVVLWGTLAVTLYAFGLYPLVVWVLSRWRRDPAKERPATEDELWPRVTLLIRAGRDEPFIVKRLENALALDYPRERLQILVGCCGEEDLTGLLARSFNRRLIEVIQIPKRGDAHVLNACLRQVRGEIVVLSDARTLMRFDALRRLAAHFQNAPTVGGVCGRIRVVGLSGRDPLDARFARLEHFLKRCESRLERLPEVKSGLFAVRTGLLAPLRERQAFDVVTFAQDIVRQGYRLIYEDRAVATRETLPRADRARSLAPRRATTRRLGLSLPAFDRRRGFISSVFWMHRVLRRLCPVFLIAAFVANACLLEDPFYLHFMLFHEAFYVAALIGLYFVSGRRGWSFGKLFRVAGTRPDAPFERVNWIPEGGAAIAACDASVASPRTVL
jgi:cellulose synthase/poly-beta-1,6-N-acetylglucosamine synthase-like glycosyltransferase